jgi:hypothetical protein
MPATFRDSEKIPKKIPKKNQYWIRWRNPASSGGTERGPGNRLGD